MYQILVETARAKKTKAEMWHVELFEFEEPGGVRNCLRVKVSLSASPTHHSPHPNPKYRGICVPVSPKVSISQKGAQWDSVFLLGDFLEGKTNL